MNQKDILSAIIRWLRYVQELRFSQPYEKGELIFTCPNTFPPITSRSEIDLSGRNGDEDLKKLRSFINAHQRDARLLQDTLIKTNPKFKINCLSLSFVKTILKEHFIKETNIEVKIKNLATPELKNENFTRKGECAYYDTNDLIDLYSKRVTTNLLLQSIKIELLFNGRVFTIKCYSYKNVMVFWESSFRGDIPKNYANQFFYFAIKKINYDDILNIKNV